MKWISDIFSLTPYPKLASFSVLYPEVALQKEQEAEEELDEFDEYDDFFAANQARISAARLSKTPSKAFANFITQLSTMTEEEQDMAIESTKMGIEEKLEMFTVSEKYTGGSVQVARGRKMTVLPGKAKNTDRQSRVHQIVSQANRRCTQAQTKKTRGKASF